MSKSIGLLLLGIYFSTITFAQIPVGQDVGNIPLPKLLNTNSTIANLDQFKGKVIWLEFWATWCSSCVVTMPHLQKLQKEYEGKLQVIAISSEREKRIEQFIQNKSSDLMFVSDTADILKRYFPHHFIPHSVLIDTKGKVVAITDPDKIDSQVIANVLSGLKISLFLKADSIISDPWLTYFDVSDTISERFIMLPKIEGSSGQSRTYDNDKAFKNRRISLINVSLESAYRIAYGDISYSRIIDLTSKEARNEKKSMFCIDLVVPKGQETKLLPTLRKHLKEKLDLKVDLERRSTNVYVLTAIDNLKIINLSKSRTSVHRINSRGDLFNGEGVQLREIAEYLEASGIVDKPVIDDTKNTEKYNINFKFMPEKKGHLEEVLATLGLKLSRSIREIDVLVFR